MYSFHTEVRYSEIGVDGTTPVSSIVNYFQDCSTFQSESIVQGISTLFKRQKGWLLTAWQININRFLELGEKITVGTWPHSFKGFYGERNFIIYDEKQTVVSEANTLWALVDIQTGHPTKITEEDRAGYDIEDPLEMKYLPRKIKTGDYYDRLEGFKVKRCNLDTNNHVNNGQYIKMAEEYIPQNAKVKRMRAEYKRSALYEDIIIPKVAVIENKYMIELCDPKDTTYAIIEFVLQDS